MKNILVIVDAQNDFINGALGSREAENCIPYICDKIKNFNDGLILTTQDTHTTDYMSTKEGSFLPVAHCIEFQKGWGINVEVSSSIIAKVATDNTVSFDGVTKPTFGSTELIETFVGFCTDICVISNALLVKTFFYDKANIFVDEKCCAGVTTEKHDAALNVMRSCQINII